MNKKTEPLIRFLKSNNLVALIMLACTFVPLYQQRQETAARVDDIAADVSLATRQIEANREADNSVVDAVADQIELQRDISRQSVYESEAAKRAITLKQFELESGYCSRFVRQVVEATHGSKYDYLFGASALISANRFLKSPYGYLWPKDKAKLGNVIQVGDILFKRTGSGGFGHVGIYVGNNMVAENSSTSIGRVQGAKGYRSLKQYGSFDVLGRLPLPTSKRAAT